MATYTLTGYGNETDETVYSGYHNVIDTNFHSTIRANIPKYARITNATVSAEFEKGYSWAKAYGWFADQNGTMIGSKHSLSNGTNSNKTANVTSWFQSENASAGQFISGKTTIRAYFDGTTVPVSFVTRKKQVTFTYDTPTYYLAINRDSYGGSGTMLLNGVETFFSEHTIPITTSTNMVFNLEAIPDENSVFEGWYQNSVLVSTNPKYSITVNQDAISSFTTNTSIIAKFKFIYYTVTLKNFDETTLYQTDVVHGYPFSYIDQYYQADNPNNYPPKKSPDSNYHYNFIGWNYSNDYQVKSNLTAIAQYQAIPHAYSTTLSK